MSCTEVQAKMSRRINESYREEQNKAVERGQQKERENTKTNEDNFTSSTKEEVESFFKKI